MNKSFFYSPLFFLLLVLASLGTPTPSLGEDQRLYQLLILDSQLGNPYDEVRHFLLEELATLGYQQGQNLNVRLHSAGNDLKKGERILAEEVAKGADVVFVGGTMATIAAKNILYGTQQPVVFGSPTDPVGIGVIDDFTHPPKANFTGVCYPVPVKARFSFLRQLLPTPMKLGLIYVNMPQSHSYNGWIRELLQKDPLFQGVQVLFREVPLITGERGDEKMAQLAIPLIKKLDGQVDAFIKPNDQMGTRRPFSEAVWQHASKPLIGIVQHDVTEKWGATAVIFPSHESIGRQTAQMIAKIFRGSAPPKILPQWPKLYGYAVDLTKMRHFKMITPVGILQLAGKENIVP